MQELRNLVRRISFRAVLLQHAAAGGDSAKPAPAESSDDPESSGKDNAALPDTGAPQAQAFAEMHARAVREVVRDVVLHLVPPSAAAAMAQAQAAILHWNAAESAALMADVQVELLRVTPDNAAEFGLVPDQVLAWRAASAAAEADLQSQSSASQTAPVAARPKLSGDPPDRHGNKVGRGLRAPASASEPVVDAGLDRQPVPGATVSRSPAGLPADLAKALTTVADPIVDQVAPGLSPPSRRLVLGAAVVIIAWVLTLAATTTNTAVAQPPLIALGALAVLVVGTSLWLRRRARNVRAAAAGRADPVSASGSAVAAVRDGGGSPELTVADRGGSPKNQSERVRSHRLPSSERSTTPSTRQATEAAAPTARK